MNGKKSFVLKGGKIYTPENIGNKDIFVGGNKIIELAEPNKLENIDKILENVEIIDISNLVVIPGLVDVHVHATGGGGEKGPASRTPEAKLFELVEAGITTVVGVLGTDSISRSLANLLVKLKALEDEGLTTYMWSGAYRMPPPTLTGSVQTDIVLIDKVIGMGEIAISDHRSNWPNLDEIKHLVGDARVAGMLSGKAGVVHFHVGSAATGLSMLWKILEETTIPIAQMYPTHVSCRGKALLDEAKKWVSAGGFVDFTSDGDDETNTIDALNQFRIEQCPLDKVTLSSDAYGSMPVFDSNGNLQRYDYQRPSVILQTLNKLVNKHSWPIELAVKLCTVNAAKVLGLQKGVIVAGGDADLVILDPKTFYVHYVISKGQILKTPTWVKRGMFE